MRSTGWSSSLSWWSSSTATAACSTLVERNPSPSVLDWSAGTCIRGPLRPGYPRRMPRQRILVQSHARVPGGAQKRPPEPAGLRRGGVSAARSESLLGDLGSRDSPRADREPAALDRTGDDAQSARDRPTSSRSRSAAAAGPARQPKSNPQGTGTPHPCRFEGDPARAPGALPDVRGDLPARGGVAASGKPVCRFPRRELSAKPAVRRGGRHGMTTYARSEVRVKAGCSRDWLPLHGSW